MENTLHILPIDTENSLADLVEQQNVKLGVDNKRGIFDLSSAGIWEIDVTVRPAEPDQSGHRIFLGYPYNRGPNFRDSDKLAEADRRTPYVFCSDENFDQLTDYLSDLGFQLE